jgi:hypothetical protein
MLARAAGRLSPIAVSTWEGSAWPVLQAEPVDMARPDSCSMSSSEQGEHLSVDDLLDLCIGENAPQSLVDLFTVHA